MTMIKASDLIASVRQAYDEKWGYIWGTRGQVWTQEKQDASTREMTIKYGQKWVGKRVADCSGLIKWAYREHGGDIYHGSNTMWTKYTADRGAVSGTVTLHPGAAVFMVNGGKRTHVGVYVGGGKCIEARSTSAGVVISDLGHWDEWGELTGIEYDLPAESIAIARRTLRKGDEGGDVETLQALLNADPRYPTKVDGIFGGDTASSVRAFQADHGLTADGICGPLTWAKLEETAQPDEEDVEDEPKEAPEAPSEPEETPSASDEAAPPTGEPETPLTVEERLTRLERAVFGQEGGESDGSMDSTGD